MGLGLLDLSNDLLRDILDQIDNNPDLTVSVDRRAYLSVESFRPPSPPPPSRAQDIGHFRLTCRRFADIGIPYQFTRVATRFSPAGFQRLEKICSCPHLARYTRKFSYLIPDFYVKGREQVGELLRRAPSDHPGLDAAHFERKAAAQHRIVASGEDLRVLTHAMQAFRALQHVQILRLQDEADRHLLDFLHESESPDEDGDDEGDGSEDGAGSDVDGTESRESSDDDRERRRRPIVDLRWTPACTRAAQTIGQALARARSPFSRFSGPMMSAQSALALAARTRLPSAVVPALAERLTCLELHLEDGALGGSVADRDARLLELSPLFRHVFAAARHMQAVHLGFPTQRPAGVALASVFHDVRWDQLRAVGVQSWRLRADEIVALARRHRKTLRGLRLRDVLLREESRWQDVLRMLREEMEHLEWVSLRRIDYAQHFDETRAGGIEVPDYPAGNGSDSDDDDFHAHIEPGEPQSDDNDEDGGGADDAHDDAWSATDSDDALSAGLSNADTDHGPDAHALPLSPDSPPSSVPWCTCGRGDADTDEDLGDDGRVVLYQQRKFWEKWVIGRCPEHGERSPS